MTSRTVKLGEVCATLSGGTPPRTKYGCFGGDIPWVKITDMLQGLVTETEETLTSEGLASCSAKLLPAGTVLVSVFATIGRTAILGLPAATNQAIAGVVPNDAKSLDTAFLRYFLDSKRHELIRAARGVAQPNINQSILRDLDLPVLPITEQRRIVDLLARAEGIVRLRREAQQKAAELIPAIFINMFGDPAKNPQGWPRQPLSAVAEVISGVAKGRKLDPGEAVELPYMRVANVKDGYLDLAEVKTIEIKRSEVEKLLIRPGDLLMTEGGDPDKLGRAALWAGEIDACVHQNHVFKVRSDRACLSPAYLRALAGSAYGKAYFLSVAKKTTGIASINKTQLSAFPVPMPPLPLQQAFERQVHMAESIQNQQAAALKMATATFDAILAQSFS